MPVHHAKQGKFWRVLDPDGKPAKNATGTAVDGGGHATRAKAIAQVAAINISEHRAGKI